MQGFDPKPLSLAVLLAFAGPALADKQLGEITVNSGKSVGARPVLRDEIIATESLGARELEKTGATMLTEALDKRPGISVQTECSICNVRNVVLNNLPGRYTTLLIDGIPIFSSVSAAYGLDSVSLGGVERIDISRGAGTSLIAPEALAGSVNMVTRRPTAHEFKAVQQFGSYGHRNTDLFGARVFDGGALTANLNYNTHDTVDADGNKVSEYTGYQRKLGGVGFFLDDIGGFDIRGRLDIVDEKRMGGAMGDNYSKVKADETGNPFRWSRGKNGSPSDAGWVAVGADGVVGTGDDSFVNYNDGLGGMSEIIFTDRQQFVSSATRKLGDGTLRLAVGLARHKQDSYYEHSIYKAKQTQYYLEASTQQPIGATLVTGGVTYRYEDLKSRGAMANGTPNNGIDNYEYKTPGLFLQAYHAFLDGDVEVNASVRYDDHNIFGGITSPRVNLLWNHSHELNSRFALGRGFRAPTSFFEQDHGILDTSRIVREIKEAEISDNASYALSYAGDRLAWVGSLNYNRIKNMALLDSGATDPLSGLPITVFTSARKPVTVVGGDLTVTYKLTPTLETTVAAERFSYHFSEAGTLAFARPEARAYLRLDYESGPWSAMARGTWTGPMDLKKFYDYANNPRYNFDGTRKMDKSPSYWTVDLRGEYRLDKRWSLFLGVDNLTDFKQSDKESMLWVDRDGAIDVTQIWGPNRGLFVYGGVKFAL
ncbi:TonB-dependent receptor plug domain-containing protein [Azonexus fungiphilus]|uniref:TonB-dependent receptor plug domain-containing protein n=1 Tax=Azonexus fungiphilus TaxID=146940 RepID=UPI00156BC749|nr:TonB-dependent receptor [Azonexus fungiphilus]NHC05886.1 TonB-dependent receptor [Azonexus fungiphilus]